MIGRFQRAFPLVFLAALASVFFYKNLAPDFGVSIISDYVDTESGVQLDFPVHRIGFDPSIHHHQGAFSVSDWTDQPATLYVPYFDGRVVIAADSVVLFDSANAMPLPNNNEVIGFSVPLPLATARVSFQMRPTDNLISRVAAPRIGPPEHIARAERAHALFNQNFRLFSFSVVSFIGLVLVISTLLYGRNTVYLLLSFAYLFTIQYASVFYSPLLKYVLSFLPVFLVVIYLYVRSALSDQGFVWPNRWCQRVVLGYVLLYGGCLALGASIQAFNLFFALPFFAIGLIVVSRRQWLLPECIGEQGVGKVLLSLMAVAGSVVFDSLFKFGLVESKFLLTPLAVFYMYSMLTLFYFEHYQRAMRRLRASRAELERRLVAQQSELAALYSEAGRIETERQNADYRLGLHRNLHDGLQGYLANILALAGEHALSADGTKRVAKLARDASAEVRLILDGPANSEEVSLFEILNSIQEQTRHRLASDGHRLVWNLTPLLEIRQVSFETCIDVLRILKEAIHNAIERADCALLVVTADADAPHFVLRVRNEGGQHLPLALPSSRGIQNMRERARALGYQLTLSPVPGGAELVLQSKADSVRGTIDMVYQGPR